MGAYTERYLTLIVLSALAAFGFMAFLDQKFELVILLYIFLSLLIAPLIISGIIMIILWYTGTNPGSKAFYNTYLIAWVINIIFSLILFITDSYQGYI